MDIHHLGVWGGYFKCDIINFSLIRYNRAWSWEQVMEEEWAIYAILCPRIQHGQEGTQEKGAGGMRGGWREARL